MSIWPNIKHFIRNRFDRISQWAKQIRIPFFDGIPLYDVGLFFWKSIVDGAISTRASAVAFNFMLAIFPAIIFVFTLIPYIPIAHFQTQLLNLLQSIMPQNAYIAVQGTIKNIVTQPRGGLLSFGFFAAFFFSTNGIVSVITAFNGSIHTIESRTWINQRLVALVLAVILTTLTTISIAMITLSQTFMKFMVKSGLLHSNITYYLLLGGKWIIICALFFFSYAFLFYLAPARKTKFRFISAGGTLATLLTIITTIGFSYYINNFGKYNTLYGSIGTLVVVMLPVYFNALNLLIGFELNVSIWQARKMDLSAKTENPTQHIS
ncbi:MAG: YihY/virulence factor BrkB family protein [Bacteroidia bacterium]|nr:YihY/virulence factor BrkB family protein [Bacteroidia bacterium]